MRDLGRSLPIVFLIELAQTMHVISTLEQTFNLYVQLEIWKDINNRMDILQ